MLRDRERCARWDCRGWTEERKHRNAKKRENRTAAIAGVSLYATATVGVATEVANVSIARIAVLYTVANEWPPAAVIRFPVIFPKYNEILTSNENVAYCLFHPNAYDVCSYELCRSR